MSLKLTRELPTGARLRDKVRYQREGAERVGYVNGICAPGGVPLVDVFDADDRRITLGLSPEQIVEIIEPGAWGKRR